MYCMYCMYCSKVSYHLLARRDSRLTRQESRLERRDFRLERQDFRLARALKNCKYGCLNFLQDFNSLLWSKQCSNNTAKLCAIWRSFACECRRRISHVYHVHKRCNSRNFQPTWFENGICEYIRRKFFSFQLKTYRSWLPRCPDLYAEIASFAGQSQWLLSPNERRDLWNH